MFANDVGGHLLDDVVRDAFYDALETAKLGHLRAKEDPIVFHDLRHTFGTTCAAKGIDLRRIQAWMGHADIQTTMRYLHYVPQHDDAARLTAAFGAEPVTASGGRTPQIGPTQGDRSGSSDPGLVLPMADQGQPARGESVHPDVHRTRVITP